MTDFGKQVLCSHKSQKSERGLKGGKDRRQDRKGQLVNKQLRYHAKRVQEPFSKQWEPLKVLKQDRNIMIRGWKGTNLSHGNQSGGGYDNVG